MLLLTIGMDEHMAREIRLFCAILGFVACILSIVQFVTEEHCDKTSTKNERLGYVFLSNTHQSGKGIARSRERVVDKMARLAATKLHRPLSVETEMSVLCDRLLDNASGYFRDCSVIMVSGNCHHIATNTLAKISVPDVQHM